MGWMTEPLWFNVGPVMNGQCHSVSFPHFLPLSFARSNEWCSYLTRYHFRCIQLSEDDASEISESYFHFTWINYARLMYPI